MEFDGTTHAQPPGVKQKRRKKRKLVAKPEPIAPGQVVSELISVVRCSLAGVVRRCDFLTLLEQVVVAANQMKKRVSMLAKELLLAKLAASDPLPALDQCFFSGLYTSLRSGKWKHGHDAILARHRVADPGLGGVMSQVMALAAKKMAAEVDTHYRSHFERFYRRWKRECCEDDQNEDLLYFLDPEDTRLETLIEAAWAMRRDLEQREARGFALFPEASTQVSYVTLDATCVAYLYRTLHPQSFREDGKQPGTTRAKPINDVTAEHGPEIFAELFDLPKIRRMRRTHHFRYALQTDGVGVALSFGRWVYSTPKSDKSDGKRMKRKTQKSSAVTKSVTDLLPGFAYSAKNKTLASHAELKATTVRCVDPGVRRTYTSVDLLTGEPDVRTSVMKSRSWQSRTRAKVHGAKMKRLHDAELSAVQGQLNTVPFRMSSSAACYARYVDGILQHWDALWAFATQRKLRFRASVDTERTLDREVDRVCLPRVGDTHTLLVYGNRASKNFFGKTKQNVKGPARKLFDTAVWSKKAVCVWADEFRTL